MIITIDGPAGVGKSTVAKLLARRLGLAYLDTGATYRALAHEVLWRGVDPLDEASVERLAGSLNLVLRRSSAEGLQVILNGRDVTRRIRSERVTETAALIAQHPRVRVRLVRLQRRLAWAHPAVVVEGRDTGSAVFPRASCKFFLAADVRVRARRRQMELRSARLPSPSLAQIERQLRARDRLDRRRRVGPLVKPDGAVTINTSRLTAPQVVERMLRALSRQKAPTFAQCADSQHEVCDPHGQAQGNLHQRGDPRDPRGDHGRQAA